jgi:hypothetical protein
MDTTTAMSRARVRQIVGRLNDRDVELFAPQRSTDRDNVPQPVRRLYDEPLIVAPTSPRLRHNGAAKRAKDCDQMWRYLRYRSADVLALDEHEYPHQCTISRRQG